MYSCIILHNVLNTKSTTLHSTSKFSTVSVERNVGYSLGEFISIYKKSATQCFPFDQKKHPNYIQCKDVTLRDFGGNCKILGLFLFTYSLVCCSKKESINDGHKKRSTTLRMECGPLTLA